ncbi:hypothetical protein J7E70_02160 [Variovorax paradoxus]|nr:hypothetical protein [Variovorax paradoxus]MBT2299258.1 hypothetical protein [Variovorax paradoxus]
MDYLQTLAVGTVSGVLGALVTLWGERHKFFWSDRIERRRFEHAMRSAALEKRLDKHQEAWTHWDNLRRAVGTRDEGAIRTERLKCDDWYSKNCLYLGPQARVAFWRSIIYAQAHFEAMQGRMPAERVIEWSQLIAAAGSVISRGVALPGFTEEEFEEYSAHERKVIE